jgi:CheY-like chemotaxis protein
MTEVRKRVLVIDDDPTFRKIAEVALADIGTLVDTAEDGSKAIARLDADNYDLVVVDLEMPGTDGFGVIRHVRTNARLADLPIIVITGRTNISSIDTAYRLGATSFVSKPVNWRLLPYKVKDVLAKGAGTRKP